LRATSARGPIFTAGPAGWWPARCRWRSGEYVSVSSQRDSEKSPLARDRHELREMPAAELDELAAIYEAKGVSPQTAAQVAAELTAHDALAAHVDVELRLDPDDLANPCRRRPRLQRRSRSDRCYPACYLVAPATFRLPVTFVAVLIALGLAGALNVDIGGSHVGRAVLRVVIGGPDEYRQLLPVLRCLPQASTVDETPGLSSSLVTATG
jgi:hypothetical protein